jgi:pimeloyl-ACP methyl ester carboxylesterase
MPFFEHDGIRFHYRETGSGVPFIFQHGLGADVNQTFDLFRPPSGIRLLTFDCRGHGETRPLGPEEGVSVQQFAVDLRAFLDHLGADRAVVGGISMGAAIALHFCLENPGRVRGLVLSRPAWVDQGRADNMRVFATLAEYIRKFGAWEGAQRYQQTEAFEHVRKVSPDNANSLLAQFTHPRAEETVAKLERIPSYIPHHPRDAWRHIDVPTLVLANRQDEIHPFEFGETFAQLIPKAEFHEITAKSTSKDRHNTDVQQRISDFLTRNFLSLKTEH